MKKENFGAPIKSYQLEEESEEEDEDEYNDNPEKYIEKILKSKKEIQENPNFIESQFNTDYRDTLNAFEIITPNVKQLFNVCALPVKQVSNPAYTEIKHLITKFIKEVNKTVKHKVSNEISCGNWIDNMPQKEVKSGWDKQQEALGLLSSIYKKPAKKSSIKLIKVDHAEKYETEKEIRYSLFLIVQKKGVYDQMVIKVNFVVNTDDENLDRDFFNKNKNSHYTTVNIEEISVIGYLTKNNFGERTTKDNFYNFDSITDGKMFSQEEIIKELNKKKAEYAEETRDY